MNPDPEEMFLKKLDEILNSIDLSSLPKGRPVVIVQMIKHTRNMTDDEKIDYYLSRKILKEFGVEI